MKISFTRPSKSRDIALIFLIVLGTLLYRRLDAFIHPQPWAEDCVVYFIEYVRYGINAMFIPYGGYLHFVPRLIAMFWGFLHVNYLYIPACYCYTAFFVAFFIALNIWKTSAYLNIKHRVLYATSFLFLPLGSDIFMNLTNINWITSLYLINFLFVRYTDYTYKHYYLNILIIFIISLSGPFSMFLSPVVLIIGFEERKKLSLKKVIPLALILACGIVQFIFIVFVTNNVNRWKLMPPEKDHLFKLITNNMEEILFMKYNFMQWVSTTNRMVISSIVFLGLLYIFISNYIKISNKRKYILLCYAIIMYSSFIKVYWPCESKVLLDNPRYYFLPFACIMWLMIISFDKRISRLFLVTYLAFFILQYRYIRMILPDMQWKQQITEYYEGKRTQINVNPCGWHFELPKRK